MQTLWAIKRREGDGGSLAFRGRFGLGVGYWLEVDVLSVGVQRRMEASIVTSLTTRLLWR